VKDDYLAVWTVAYLVGKTAVSMGFLLALTSAALMDLIMAEKTAD
jgi:hypothetical protein